MNHFSQNILFKANTLNKECFVLFLQLKFRLKCGMILFSVEA